eukprot:COSAG01_NODE_162_length_23597_cov_21.924130_15_plen_104_part_00
MQEQFEQALQQERRPDRDGRWRTREEFVAIYGEETGEGGGSVRCPQWDATRSGGGVGGADTAEPARRLRRRACAALGGRAGAQERRVVAVAQRPYAGGVHALG